MQRLFSTFANGWPGLGLLIQRLVVGSALLHNGIAKFNETSAVSVITPASAEALAGLLILAGLWTPVAGALVAAIELWIAFSGADNVWMSLLLAVLGGTLAMIGPGAWSADARLFGRKHIGR